MPADELANYAGRYRNGTNVEELLARDGKLFFKRVLRENEVVSLGEGRFQTKPDRAEFLLVMGKNGKAEFLFRGGRALARISK